MIGPDDFATAVLVLLVDAGGSWKCDSPELTWLGVADVLEQIAREARRKHRAEKHLTDLREATDRRASNRDTPVDDRPRYGGHSDPGDSAGRPQPRLETVDELRARNLSNLTRPIPDPTQEQQT